LRRNQTFVGQPSGFASLNPTYRRRLIHAASALSCSDFFSVASSTSGAVSAGLWLNVSPHPQTVTSSGTRARQFGHSRVWRTATPD